MPPQPGRRDELRRYADEIDFADASLTAGAEWVLLRKRLELVEATCLAWAARMPPALHRAVPRRQYEFILGRLAAATLIGERGRAAAWPGMAGRRPVWPAGLLGSISHSETLVAAAVADEDGALLSMGIDVERLGLEAETLAALTAYFKPAEQAALAVVPDGLVIGFAAKEALFKAVNPLNDVFFDFTDAAVVELEAGVDGRSGRLALALLRRLDAGFAAGRVLHARWRLAEGHVLAAVDVHR